MHEWRKRTRGHRNYRAIYWLAFAVTLGITLPLAFVLARKQSDPAGLFALPIMSIFFAFLQAEIVPYFVTRKELKQLVGEDLARRRQEATRKAE